MVTIMLSVAGAHEPWAVEVKVRVTVPLVVSVVDG